MSIYRSYFSRNNTIISNSLTNTGRNPVIELSYGASDYLIPNYGYSRFIFDLDLSGLTNNIREGLISTGCTNNMTHTLMMTNTSSFQEDLLNTKMTNGRRRATSFDLILFRIPPTNGIDGDPQPWDEGVGYDYNEFRLNVPNNLGNGGPLTFIDDKSFSTRPSNWYKRQTLYNWSESGIYNNKNLGVVNYDDLDIISTQHFEFGNEDINFDMTNEINGILTGNTQNVTGWGIAYMPEVENITGLTEAYCVGFFSRHTQTFYQPFLQTTYDDLILDDRNTFVKNQTNKIYLYAYVNGDLATLDELPFVNIYDRNDEIVLNDLVPCLKTKGVYEVTVPNSFQLYNTPCEFYDVWSNLKLNGEDLSNVTNQFILRSSSVKIDIGTQTKTPDTFGFNFYGIRQDEKILNTEVRKVGVVIKKSYTTQTLLSNVEIFYRVFVKEGTTEVQVQEWTKINRTPNEYYFIFDTTDKIPNQYYVDIKVNISGQKDIYKKQLTFQIVDKK
jgi:hypothetical protein